MKNEGLKPFKYGYGYIYVYIYFRYIHQNLKVVGSQVGGYASFCMPLHINYSCFHDESFWGANCYGQGS